MIAQAWLIAGLQRQKILKPLDALLSAGSAKPAPLGKQIRAWATLHNLKHAARVGEA